MSLNESIIEDATLEWFEALGYAIGHGLYMAPGSPAAERDSLGDVVLPGRMCDTLLPKLLSGELCAARLEHTLEAAA